MVTWFFTRLTIQWGKGKSFQQMILEQMHSYMQQNKTEQSLDALISCHTKINLKWITDLTVRAKTKISKWKHWSVPCDPGLGKAQLRVQNFYSSRDTVKKSKRQALGQTSLIKGFVLIIDRFYKGVKYWKNWMSISPRKIYKWQTSTNA